MELLQREKVSLFYPAATVQPACGNTLRSLNDLMVLIEYDRKEIA